MFWYKIIGKGLEKKKKEKIFVEFFSKVFEN